MEEYVTKRENHGITVTRRKIMEESATSKNNKLFSEVFVNLCGGTKPTEYAVYSSISHTIYSYIVDLSYTICILYNCKALSEVFVNPCRIPCLFCQLSLFATVASQGKPFCRLGQDIQNIPDFYLHPLTQALTILLLLTLYHPQFRNFFKFTLMNVRFILPMFVTMYTKNFQSLCVNSHKE